MSGDDFRPGDTVVARYRNGGVKRYRIVVGADGRVRTSRGKVRFRSIDADGRFTSGVQTAWWTPERMGGGTGQRSVERAS